jgi:hypothetical protein
LTAATDVRSDGTSNAKHHAVTDVREDNSGQSPMWSGTTA